MTDWENLDNWWRSELTADTGYVNDVRPLFDRLLAVAEGALVLDLGTGTGWALERIKERGGRPVGLDRNLSLAKEAGRQNPVVVGALPGLRWCRSETFEAVTAVLVFEHVDDVGRAFEEVARVTRSGGTMTLVLNHPQITAPGSAPVVDPVDGELFWRWGEYLSAGSTDEPAGSDTITFHHRPIGELLNSAAAAGWILEHIEEQGLSEETVAGDALLMLQQGVPRLLGVRWRKP